MNRPIIKFPIIVEGKYDKAAVCSVVCANVIATDGFGIFREHEKRALLRRLAENGGVIVLTDSDNAGLVIRGHISSVLPRGSVFHAYIPRIEGKERRKDKPSKEGLLGVEGVDAELILAALAPFTAEENPQKKASETPPIIKTDFYDDGFCGGHDSAQKRRELALFLSLPSNISSNALLAAINMLGLQSEYKKFSKKNKD